MLELSNECGFKLVIILVFLPPKSPLHVHPLVFSVHPFTPHVGELIDPPVHLHLFELSVPSEEHWRICVFIHSQPFWVNPEGHLGLAVPVHNAVEGESVLPDGQLGVLWIEHRLHALFNLKPLGQVGIVFLSQAHSPLGLTIFVKPDGQVESLLPLQWHVPVFSCVPVGHVGLLHIWVERSTSW